MKKKVGFTSLITVAVTAAVLGFAGTAQADIGHHDWANTVGQPSVYVPHVDTTVHR